MSEIQNTGIILQQALHACEMLVLQPTQENLGCLEVLNNWKSPVTDNQIK